MTSFDALEKQLAECVQRRRIQGQAPSSSRLLNIESPNIESLSFRAPRAMYMSLNSVSAGFLGCKRKQ